MILLGILIFSSISINVYGFTPDLNGRLYNPTLDIEYLRFKIKSKDLNELLHKYETGLKVVSASVFKRKQTSEVKLDGEDSYPKELKNRIRQIFSLKAKIVLGFDLDQWLVNYKMKSSKDNIFIYYDETELMTVTEIEIKKLESKVFITEKLLDGIQRTEYIYEKLKWSKEQLVLTEVIKFFKQGRDEYKTVSEIMYKKFKQNWMPSELKTYTTQILGDDVDVERKIVESFTFSEYKIDKK